MHVRTMYGLVNEIELQISYLCSVTVSAFSMHVFLIYYPQTWYAVFSDHEQGTHRKCESPKVGRS